MPQGGVFSEAPDTSKADACAAALNALYFDKDQQECNEGQMGTC